MSEKDYYSEFVKFETDYLITLRARGEELNEEAHAAIETIAKERGEKLPPKPSQFIFAKSHKTEGKILTLIGIPLLIYLLIRMVAQVLPKQSFLLVTQILILLTLNLFILFIAYYGYKFIKRMINKEETKKYEKRKAIEDKGLSELMIYAADGEFEKVRDIVSYKKEELNRKCNNGSTALMYAVRNNQYEITKLLIENGADITIENNSEQTAKTIADKFASKEIRNLFK